MTAVRSVSPPTDILLKTREDRRLLPHLPSSRRSGSDRRGQIERARHTPRAALNRSLPEHRSKRYIASLPVSVRCYGKHLPVQRWQTTCADLSTSGILLCDQTREQKDALDKARKIKLRFRIRPGDMPEGYEMRVRIAAQLARRTEQSQNQYDCGLMFRKSLVDYAYRHKGRRFRRIALLMLMLMALLVVFLRVENVRMFQFQPLVFLYSIITASYLLSRYLFAALYRPTPQNPDFHPPVSIIIPCFNEEEWIQRTITSCLDQTYPSEQLEVIVVDDCSSDASSQQVESLMKALFEADPSLKQRLRFVRQSSNLGKREAMARGARMARHELLVFVDSDSFLEPDAVMQLVQPMQDPKVGGCTGRTDVANTYTNFITKMQSVRYYISFRIMKAAEGYFDAVTCLSGPLSCYRKEIVLQYCEPWLHQTFLRRRATFGDDRSMTNFILRRHRTAYQDTAVCATIVPNTHRMFLRQQMRWKRSWLRESSIAAGFMWKKEPLMALSFYFGFLIPIFSPMVVVYNLLYIPIAHGYFPRTFLIGLLAMSMLMGMAQLLLRRSRTWVYGIIFCAYHIMVLMWQMPIAWVTFWKSTWGTRMTPQDMNASHPELTVMPDMKGG